MKETLNLEKIIDNIFEQLGFADYFKSPKYIKDAILFTYYDKFLLLNANLLVLKKFLEKNGIVNPNSVRCKIDKTLNERLDSINAFVLYDVFRNNYDVKKICSKYFIELNFKYSVFLFE